MNILVVSASRHGSTHQIADEIAEQLRTHGNVIEVRDACDRKENQPYDAAIIGSAIYMGKWLSEASDYVERNEAELATVPVWLFSSGPLGEADPVHSDEPAQLAKLLEITRARDHRMFVGKLDKSRLGLGERLAVKLVKAPEGDFRDWEAVRGWARGIASELATADALT